MQTLTHAQHKHFIRHGLQKEVELKTTYCSVMSAFMHARGLSDTHSNVQEPARHDERAGQCDTLAALSSVLPHAVCKQLVIIPLYLCLPLSLCPAPPPRAVSQLVLSASSYLFPISLVTYSNTGLEFQGPCNPARRISSQHHLD